MRVTPYERVAGWLVALLVLVGTAVLIMFLIWLTHVLVFTKEVPPIVPVENIAGRGDHAAGYERDIEAPGIEELEEEMEPQVEQLLEAVTDIVSTQAASLDAIQTDAVTSNAGKGVGDSRPPGPLGEGENIIPRWERWKIQYNTTTLDLYARQLDFFGIELAAAGGGRALVDYASGFSSPRPKRRQGPPDQEKRLYMVWTSGTLRRYDLQLLRRAGIPTSGRIIMQFYPKRVEDRLAALELQYARRNGRQSVKEIQQTVFGVRRSGNGYEYYIISQTYRAVPG